MAAYSPETYDPSPRLGDNRRAGLTDAYDTLCKAAGVIVQQEGGVVGARALAYAECAEIVRKMRDGTGENCA